MAAIVLGSFHPKAAYAGAWPSDPGTGQIISTTSYNQTSRAYDDKWKLSKSVTFSKVDNQFYWEHGLTKKLTFVGQTVLQDVDYTSRDGRAKITGFGTSLLGVRHQVYSGGPYVAAGQVSVLVAGKGENIADADLGRGGNGVEIRGLIGRNFKALNRSGFVDAQAAWIYRTGQSPKTYKGDFTVGFDVLKETQILGQAFYTQTGEQVLGIDRVEPNKSLKLQASFVKHRSKKISYQTGVFRTVAGKNIIRESGVFASVWRRY